MGPKRLIHAMVLAGKSVPVIAIACASAGVVIGSIALTGIGFKIGALIFTFSGNSGFVALILIAMLSIIFGMGLPTTSAYIIAAALGVSSLTAFGFSALSAHLFVFYFAVLSNMTPPVALASFAAGTVAKEDPMKIALTAMRVGVVAFIVPFAFMYDPIFLLEGSAIEIFQVCLIAVVSAFYFAIGFSGYFNERLNWVMRCGLVGSGLLCFFPVWKIRLIGMALGAVVIAFLYFSGATERKALRVASEA